STPAAGPSLGAELARMREQDAASSESADAAEPPPEPAPGGARRRSQASTEPARIAPRAIGSPPPSAPRRPPRAGERTRQPAATPPAPGAAGGVVTIVPATSSLGPRPAGTVALAVDGRVVATFDVQAGRIPGSGIVPAPPLVSAAGEAAGHTVTLVYSGDAA